MTHQITCTGPHGHDDDHALTEPADGRTSGNGRAHRQHDDHGGHDHDHAHALHDAPHDHGHHQVGHDTMGHVHEHDHHHGHEPSPDHGHGHSHSHHHGSGPWAKVSHTLSHLFGTHSHDVADQIDDALEADARGRKALWLSLAILGVTALGQGIVVWMSGSVALLGDTLHNVADAMTALPLLVAFTLARRAPNDRFTYGYGRAEDLAGLFVVAMITLSSVMAGYEAIHRLLNPAHVGALGAVAAAGLLGFIGNEVVARYRIHVGRQIGSAALVADGLHARTDGFTSLAVLLGAGGVALGWDWADPVIGLVITVAILGVLRSAVVQVGARLMDAVDPELVERARRIAGDTDGVQSVDAVRMRWIGHSLHAEIEVTGTPGRPADDLHDMAHRIEERLVADLARLSAATVHVCPAESRDHTDP